MFHAASIWSLTIASRIVDLVHYASVEENNSLVLRLKQEFRNGIVIKRKDIESYITEDDVVLIGPGMVRSEKEIHPAELPTFTTIEDIEAIEDEGIVTYALTDYLLRKFNHKQWVIDAGALQMLNLESIPKRAILTPHHGEWEILWQKHLHASHNTENSFLQTVDEQIAEFALTYQCIVLVKGTTDTVFNGLSQEGVEISGGNAGMTKGGTGDVLAGLIAALVCKSDPWNSTVAGSFINKRAGDRLFEDVGPFFNATDLANQIPKTMKELLLLS